MKHPGAEAPGFVPWLWRSGTSLSGLYVVTIFRDISSTLMAGGAWGVDAKPFDLKFLKGHGDMVIAYFTKPELVDVVR
jgi:hypothetical protein